MAVVKNVLILATGLALVAGCSSGGSVAVPPAPLKAAAPVPSSAPSKTTSAKTGASFVFKITTAASKSHALDGMKGQRPLHLPASSQSIAIKISYDASATTGTPGTVAATANLDFTGLACVTDPNTGYQTCTATVDLAPDAYVADLTVYDGAGETGNVLSQALATPFVVTVNSANSVPVTLIGVPASLVLFTGTRLNQYTFGTNPVSYEIPGVVPVTISLVPYDADGNPIFVGVPTPTSVSFTTSNPTMVSVTRNGTSLSANIQAESVGASATITGTVTYGASTLSGSLVATPVQELFLAGTNGALTGYGMFASFPQMIDFFGGFQSGPIIVRTLHDRKTLAVLGQNGTFYSVGRNLTPTMTVSAPNANFAHDFALSSDDSTYYVSRGTGVSALSAATGAVVRTYVVNNSTTAGVDVNASGDVFVATASGAIYKLASGGTSFSSYIAGLSNPTALRIGNVANGGLLYEADGNGQLNIYNGTSKVNFDTVNASAFAFDAAGDAFSLDNFMNPPTLHTYLAGKDNQNARGAFAPGSGYTSMDVVI